MILIDNALDSIENCLLTDIVGTIPDLGAIPEVTPDNETARRHLGLTQEEYYVVRSPFLRNPKMHMLCAGDFVDEFGMSQRTTIFWRNDPRELIESCSELGHNHWLCVGMLTTENYINIWEANIDHETAPHEFLTFLGIIKVGDVAVSFSIPLRLHWTNEGCLMSVATDDEPEECLLYSSEPFNEILFDKDYTEKEIGEFKNIQRRMLELLPHVALENNFQMGGIKILSQVNPMRLKELVYASEQGQDRYSDGTWGASTCECGVIVVEKLDSLPEGPLYCYACKTKHKI